MSGAPGRGRRPGAPDTREEILAVARGMFAAQGYAGTTVRGVARAAAVDPALVHHYFGAKDALFLAALALPVDPRDLLAPLAEGSLADLAPRLIRTVLGVWDDRTNRASLLAFARGTLGGAETQPLLEAALSRLVLGAVTNLLTAGGVPPPEARTRAAYAATQVAGVLLLRYVVGLEPLASAPAEEVVAQVAPALQLHLTGPLPG